MEAAKLCLGKHKTDKSNKTSIATSGSKLMNRGSLNASKKKNLVYRNVN